MVVLGFDYAAGAGGFLAAGGDDEENKENVQDQFSHARDGGKNSTFWIYASIGNLSINSNEVPIDSLLPPGN